MSLATTNYARIPSFSTWVLDITALRSDHGISRPNEAEQPGIVLGAKDLMKSIADRLGCVR